MSAFHPQRTFGQNVCSRPEADIVNFSALPISIWRGLGTRKKGPGVAESLLRVCNLELSSSQLHRLGRTPPTITPHARTDCAEADQHHRPSTGLRYSCYSSLDSAHAKLTKIYDARSVGIERDSRERVAARRQEAEEVLAIGEIKRLSLSTVEADQDGRCGAESIEQIEFPPLAGIPAERRLATTCEYQSTCSDLRSVGTRPCPLQGAGQKPVEDR
jgi:hypothetical protein